MKITDHIADRIETYEAWCARSYAAQQLPPPAIRRKTMRPRDWIYTTIVALLALAVVAEIAASIALR